MKQDINRLKGVLAERDLNNKWLAEQMGKSACTVSKWCSNSSQPDLATLDKIARVRGTGSADPLNFSLPYYGSYRLQIVAV